jgi:hypothetical protein
MVVLMLSLATPCEQSNKGRHPFRQFLCEHPMEPDHLPRVRDLPRHDRIMIVNPVRLAACQQIQSSWLGQVAIHQIYDFGLS